MPPTRSGTVYVRLQPDAIFLVRLTWRTSSRTNLESRSLMEQWESTSSRRLMVNKWRSFASFVSSLQSIALCGS